MRGLAVALLLCCSPAVAAEWSGELEVRKSTDVYRFRPEWFQMDGDYRVEISSYPENMMIGLVTPEGKVLKPPHCSYQQAFEAMLLGFSGRMEAALKVCPMKRWSK